MARPNVQMFGGDSAPCFRWDLEAFGGAVGWSGLRGKPLVPSCSFFPNSLKSLVLLPIKAERGGLVVWGSRPKPRPRFREVPHTGSILQKFKFHIKVPLLKVEVARGLLVYLVLSCIEVLVGFYPIFLCLFLLGFLDFQCFWVVLNILDFGGRGNVLGGGH